MLLAASVVAAVAMTRKAQGEAVTRQGVAKRERAPKRFVLSKDVPSLQLRRGELLRVEPEALIYVGDIVALKSEQQEVVLTRYHDELMHCVSGLVVREARAMSAY